MAETAGLDRAPGASRARTRVVLVALVALGVLVVPAVLLGAGPAGARPARVGQDPVRTVAQAQRDLEQAIDALAGFEAELGTSDPAGRVADLDAELAGLEQQRDQTTDVDGRAQLEFAIGALQAERSALLTALPEHAALVGAVADARAALLDAKATAPGPGWATAATTPEEAAAAGAPAPTSDDDGWAVAALVIGILVLVALAAVAVRHQRWKLRLFELEARPAPRVDLEELADPADDERPAPRWAGVADRWTLPSWASRRDRGVP